MATVWGFGIVQAQEIERAGRGAVAELCELASEATGLKFRPVVAPTYQELTVALERGTMGVAWLPPIPTIELQSRLVTTVLAIPARNGTTSYHSALIVRRGVGPRTIEELAKRRAVWVQRDSAAGYVVPRMHLASRGIDVLRYFSREIFVHSHPGVIDAIVSGEADVGATYCHVDSVGKIVRAAWIDDDGRSTRQIDALQTFGPIPNDALVGSNALEATDRTTLARWLLDTPPRAKELFSKLLGSGDFRVPSPAHYEPLRHMLRAARARGHDAMPSSSRQGIRVARRVT